MSSSSNSSFSDVSYENIFNPPKVKYRLVTDEICEILDELILNKLYKKFQENPFSDTILNLNFEYFVDSLLHILYLSDMPNFHIFLDSVLPR